ncbi:MAG: DNA polymerase III subunit beta [Clostridiales bacterium]|jgi:DNA polymerase-3 subunit beta|nr:DNA polymerase III subunit beta [Clostridiales bacterium]
MKITCEKAILQNALQDTIRAVAAKSTIPALEGFLLRADQALEITGFNGDLGIRTTVDADIHVPGELVLPAKLTLDIVRSLPDNIITVESDERFMTTISCGASVFNLIGINPVDFPELPVLLQKYTVSIPSQTLKSMINGTIFAVSTNENNLVMTGCKFIFENNTLTVVALDFFRMAVCSETVERESDDLRSFVVPGKTLRELERFLTDSDDSISISLSSRNIAFSINSTVITSQLLEGEFMNYKNVLPKSSSLTVEINTASFIRSLERTSILINETLRNYTEFLFDGDTLKLTCTTSVGRAYDECPIHTIDGGRLRIGFNNRYLLDALRVCKDETVLLQLNSELSPCVIVPKEGDNYLYFVMPTRLRD